jgi:hypothetical protein
VRPRAWSDWVTGGVQGGRIRLGERHQTPAVIALAHGHDPAGVQQCNVARVRRVVHGVDVQHAAARELQTDAAVLRVQTSDGDGTGGNAQHRRRLAQQTDRRPGREQTGYQGKCDHERSSHAHRVPFPFES